MRPADLIRRLEGQPFRAFRIHLADGTVIDVSKPNMAMVGLSAAILPTAFTKDEEGNDLVKDWRTIALVHMTQFSNPGERANGKGRKRE